MRLANKSALITGAARGLGRTFAEAYVREGATAAIPDIDRAPAEAAAPRAGDPSPHGGVHHGHRGSTPQRLRDQHGPTLHPPAPHRPAAPPECSRRLANGDEVLRAARPA